MAVGTKVNAPAPATAKARPIPPRRVESGSLRQEEIIAALSSEGRPLELTTRARMERAFGRSFADVRVHDGGAANDQAEPSGKRTPREIAEEAFKSPTKLLPFRTEMEQSFGMDLSHIKAHIGPEATAAAQELGAKGFALGQHIGFLGEPDKGTVAHELSHVVRGQGKGSGDGVDTSGEAQAEAVRKNVEQGKPATEGVEGEAGNGGLALEAAGPDTNFALCMTFSKDAFEKSWEYTIWDEPLPPLPVCAYVNIIIDPSVKVVGKGGAKWGGQDKGMFSMQLGVQGEVGLGLSAGRPRLAEVYLTGNPGVFGGGTFKVGGKQWSLEAGIDVSLSGKIGVKLGGVVDWALQLVNFDIFNITGLKWDQDGFKSNELGFKWGKDIIKAFAAVEAAINEANKLGGAAMSAFHTWVLGSLGWPGMD